MGAPMQTRYLHTNHESGTDSSPAMRYGDATENHESHLEAEGITEIGD